MPSDLRVETRCRSRVYRKCALLRGLEVGSFCPNRSREHGPLAVRSPSDFERKAGFLGWVRNDPGWALSDPVFLPLVERPRRHGPTRSSPIHPVDPDWRSEDLRKTKVPTVLVSRAESIARRRPAEKSGVKGSSPGLLGRDRYGRGMVESKARSASNAV